MGRKRLDRERLDDAGGDKDEGESRGIQVNYTYDEAGIGPRGLRVGATFDPILLRLSAMRARRLGLAVGL